MTEKCTVSFPIADGVLPKLTRLTRASNGSMVRCKGYKELAMIDMGVVPCLGSLRGKKLRMGRDLNLGHPWYLLILHQTVLGVMSLQIRLPSRCKWVQSSHLLQHLKTMSSGTTEWVILDVALSMGNCIPKWYYPSRVTSVASSIQYWPVIFWTWTVLQFADHYLHQIHTAQYLLDIAFFGRSRRFVAASVDSSP